jgi:hypothetical protein
VHQACIVFFFPKKKAFWYRLCWAGQMQAHQRACVARFVLCWSVEASTQGPFSQAPADPVLYLNTVAYCSLRDLSGGSSNFWLRGCGSVRERERDEREE